MLTPLWTGSIAFGLVTIPVRLYTAVKSKDIRFHLLREQDGARVRQKFISGTDQEEVERDELVRGYEVEPDRYVVIEDEELEALAPLARRTIEITEFVNLTDIDPVYFERPYYLGPEEGFADPYRLLLEALKRSGKAGLGSFMLRTKEHLVALRPLGDLLCLETLFFQDEVMPASEVPGVPVPSNIGDREVGVAESIVEAMAGPFEPDQYRDHYREALMDLIRRKAEGQQVPSLPVESSTPANVVDLMQALEASLAEARRRKKSA